MPTIKREEKSNAISQIEFKLNKRVVRSLAGIPSSELPGMAPAPGSGSGGGGGGAARLLRATMRARTCCARDNTADGNDERCLHKWPRSCLHYSPFHPTFAPFLSRKRARSTSSCASGGRAIPASPQGRPEVLPAPLAASPLSSARRRSWPQEAHGQAKTIRN